VAETTRLPLVAVLDRKIVVAVKPPRTATDEPAQRDRICMPRHHVEAIDLHVSMMRNAREVERAPGTGPVLADGQLIEQGTGDDREQGPSVVVTPAILKEDAADVTRAGPAASAKVRPCSLVWLERLEAWDSERATHVGGTGSWSGSWPSPGRRQRQRMEERIRASGITIGEIGRVFNRSIEPTTSRPPPLASWLLAFRCGRLTAVLAMPTLRLPSTSMRVSSRSPIAMPLTLLARSSPVSAPPRHAIPKSHQGGAHFGITADAQRKTRPPPASLALSAE
jgi:hypothetical protein